eukprot:1139837-Pelagomonas_calceolata.AAC.4
MLIPELHSDAWSSRPAKPRLLSADEASVHANFSVILQFCKCTKVKCCLLSRDKSGLGAAETRAL